MCTLDRGVQSQPSQQRLGRPWRRQALHGRQLRPQLLVSPYSRRTPTAPPPPPPLPTATATAPAPAPPAAATATTAAAATGAAAASATATATVKPRLHEWAICHLLLVNVCATEGSSLHNHETRGERTSSCFPHNHKICRW